MPGFRADGPMFLIWTEEMGQPACDARAVTHLALKAWPVDIISF